MDRYGSWLVSIFVLSYTIKILVWCTVSQIFGNAKFGGSRCCPTSWKKSRQCCTAVEILPFRDHLDTYGYIYFDSSHLRNQRTRRATTDIRKSLQRRKKTSDQFGAKNKERTHPTRQNLEESSDTRPSWYNQRTPCSMKGADTIWTEQNQIIPIFKPNNPCVTFTNLQLQVRRCCNTVR